MTFKLIADAQRFSSWCLLPTILCGTYSHIDGDAGGWCYLYWIKGHGAGSQDAAGPFAGQILK